MPVTQSRSYTSFDGPRRIARGSLQANALAVKKALEGQATGPVLIFDDATGRSIDLDIRGSDEELAARLTATSPAELEPPRGPGRPKMGVVAREVTLLPRHWEWLAAQPGGASVALRKLVEEARRLHGPRNSLREAHERAYHFMLAMAGNLMGFEEATRALFANEPLKVRELVGAWPGDISDHVMQLASVEERESS